MNHHWATQHALRTALENTAVPRPPPRGPAEQRQGTLARDWLVILDVSQNTLVSCPGCRYLGGAGDSWYYTTKAFYPDDSAATTDDSVLAAANNVTLDANMNGCNITIPCYSQLASCAAATDCPAADTLPACSIQAMYRVASSCSILPVSSPASPSPAMAPSPVPIGMLPVNSPALPSPALAPSPVAHGFLPVNSPASPPPALAPSPVPTPPLQQAVHQLPRQLQPLRSQPRA